MRKDEAMKLRSTILCILLATLPGLFAQPAETFREAQAAYDDGRYADAARLFENMRNDGIDNVEVQYNLANAHFRNGDLARAVQHYRTAWYAAPRDPDIAANLKFALNAAGSVEPAFPLPVRLLTHLSLQEWIWVAIGSYLGLAVILLAALFIRRARAGLLKFGLLPTALLLLAGGGYGQWRAFRTHPEAVVTQAGTTARFSPLEGATAHYKIPEGSIVRQRNSDPKGWMEVEYDRKRGWVKEEQLIRLSP
jgi:tetratricopeptide (TPR) repeat protein